MGDLQPIESGKLALYDCGLCFGLLQLVPRHGQARFISNVCRCVSSKAGPLVSPLVPRAKAETAASQQII